MEKRTYNLSRQETNYYCFPAVLQAVLRRYGRNETQKTIADAIGCTEELKSDFRIIETLNLLQTRSLDFHFFNHNQVPMMVPELIISDWFEKDKDLFVASLIDGEHRHTRLAIDYDGRNLLMLDPKDCKEYSENLDNLYTHMRRTAIGGFGLINPLIEG